MKKASSETMFIIIGLIIALVVLVVMMVIFSSQSGQSSNVFSFLIKNASTEAKNLSNNLFNISIK